MATTIDPIQTADLDEVGQFLHDNLAKRISARDWSGSLRHRWAEQVPNHGMQMRADGKLVGVMLAVYSDQWIDGKIEHFCNPHSWCVLDEHRHASLNLVLALIKQRGYHYTMFTPNPKVAQVFLGLRFKLLDNRLLYLPNLLPRLWGGVVESRTEHIAPHLSGTALQQFEAHRQIPWLQFVAFGEPGDMCLAIYKRIRWKKMACAMLMHLSDPAALERHGGLLRRHLLLERGMPVTRVEARFLSSAPRLAVHTVRTQPKLVSTRTLQDHQILDVYSELMALDI